MVIAALFVDPRGCYVGLEGVDPWDERRDARLYAGPHPVVAHPPCSRWCAMAPVNQKRYGQRIGDDGGCFEAALRAVRTWGGVLEHPAKSYAWEAFQLHRPPAEGWSDADSHGGRTARIEQAMYGHKARKATWLYAVGAFPDLLWGRAAHVTHTISFCKNRQDAASRRPRLSKKLASATPHEFRDALIALARNARGSE